MLLHRLLQIVNNPKLRPFCAINTLFTSFNLFFFHLIYFSNEYRNLIQFNLPIFKVIFFLKIILQIFVSASELLVSTIFHQKGVEDRKKAMGKWMRQRID